MKVLYILHQYKKEFSDRTHLEYQPTKEVLQIKNGDSTFWNRVFQDHFLTGLVYGYGEKSSYLYEWSDKYLPSIRKERRLFMSNNNDMTKITKLKAKKEVTPFDLAIPAYFHFGISDPKKIEYEIEREKIITQFNKKDFFFEVMRILKGQD